MAPSCACAGVWDAARPVHRRQPIAARRARCAALLKGIRLRDAGSVLRGLRGCEPRARRERQWVGTGPAGMSRGARVLEQRENWGGVELFLARRTRQPQALPLRPLSLLRPLAYRNAGDCLPAVQRDDPLPLKGESNGTRAMCVNDISRLGQSAANGGGRGGHAYGVLCHNSPQHSAVPCGRPCMDTRDLVGPAPA